MDTITSPLGSIAIPALTYRESTIPYRTATAVCIICCLTYLFAFRKRARQFPGPKGLPLVGNTFQVPTIRTWRYFEKLSAIYGPLVRLSLGGDELLILSNSSDAEELLGRRSYNYSSRKPLIYAGKYQSEGKRLVLLPYGDTLKKHRAAFHQMLQPRVVGAYETMQELESSKLLVDLLERPLEMYRHSVRFAASLVFTLSYGKRLDDDDADLNAIQSILENFTKDTYPGSHIVDTFPVLDHLPDFLAPWRAQAREKHKREMNLYNRLALEVKSKIADGDIALECFAARLWDQKEKMGLDLDELSYVAGSAFEAGTDTTASTVLWFFLAMLMYPDTQKQAQSELDRVLGSDGKTMPSFAHLGQLPYCTALMKEVFRWAPAAPGGFPHYSDADDEYQGYHIKKGTMIVPCIWNMHHNETEFPDAFTFNPERFLEDSCTPLQLTEGHYGFGFGRRKCPGQYLAAKTIWIGLVRILWGFDVLHPATGEPQHLPHDLTNCTSGMTSRPTNFKAVISPRSSVHAETIRRASDMYN
ncbi:cytochrome P450 [Leucogyrophana mollusca]|uniref:Cytochrome P450 n=1 Tax=Leucogyrophana mollusca TaxID=85980 RepID=A0ACB8BMS3_9AGAM|nr:cytochrome P450 [Leucogyrophana mollusca]